MNLQVIDNFLDYDDFILLQNELGYCGWRLENYSTGLQRSQKKDQFWIKVPASGSHPGDFYNNSALLNDPFYQYLGDKVKWKLRRITGHYRLKLDQININGQSFGQDGWVHHDRPDDRHLGLLLFASPTWDRDWGGEFVVYDIFDRPTYVNNIPNRAVLFPPNVDHRGVAPSRKSTALRVTMVFFFEKI